MPPSAQNKARDGAAAEEGDIPHIPLAFEIDVGLMDLETGSFGHLFIDRFVHAGKSRVGFRFGFRRRFSSRGISDLRTLRAGQGGDADGEQGHG